MQLTANSRKFRTLRTGAALQLEAIRQYAPSVFAPAAGPTTSERYAYIPTIEPLERLLSNGWSVYEVSQCRVLDPSKEPFTKHSLRLRRDADWGRMNKYGGAAEGVGELVLTNAHDGTSAYTLTAGYYRLVCSNGMTTGKQVAAHRVVHAKGRTTGEIIDVAARVIEEDFPRMLEQIDMFKRVELSEVKRDAFARAAMELRYGNAWQTAAPFKPAELLHVRRPADAGDSAWAVLNRIQENVMQGGWETKSTGYGRKSRVRPVEAILPAARINRGLWAVAEELCDA